MGEEPSLLLYAFMVGWLCKITSPCKGYDGGEGEKNLSETQSLMDRDFACVRFTFCVLDVQPRSFSVGYWHAHPEYRIQSVDTGA